MIAIVIEQFDYCLFWRTKEMIINRWNSLVSIINIYESIFYQQATWMKNLKKHVWENEKI